MEYGGCDNRKTLSRANPSFKRLRIARAAAQWVGRGEEKRR
jgi:hypothetical protein